MTDQKTFTVCVYVLLFHVLTQSQHRRSINYMHTRTRLELLVVGRSSSAAERLSQYESKVSLTLVNPNLKS